MPRMIHSNGSTVPGTPDNRLANGIHYLQVLGGLLYCLAGAGEKHREVADGAGRDGAGQPQQRERHRAAGPRSRPRLGRLRRGRGLGLHREAAAEERRSGGGGGGGEPASRQHFGLRKGKETKSTLLMLHSSRSAAGG